jgi:hypothetical protein
MADIGDFEDDAIELISDSDDTPAAVMQFSEDGDGVEMLLRNGEIGRGPSPQLDLLAAYVLQVANRNGLDVGEVFEAVDERLAAWSEEGGIHLGEEDR